METKIEHERSPFISSGENAAKGCEGKKRLTKCDVDVPPTATSDSRVGSR